MIPRTVVAETFDPVSGTAYYLSLLVFMLPLWFEPREEVPA